MEYSLLNVMYFHEQFISIKTLTKNETFSLWNYHKIAKSEKVVNFSLSLMVWFLFLIKRNSNWLTTLFACIYIIILTDCVIYFIQVE